MHINLSEDEVLFLTELLVLTHLISIMGKHHSKPGTSQAFTVETLGVMVCEPLRSLLREPLQDPEFRRRFNEHFKNHPHQHLSGAGFDWLQEQLTFES